MSFPLDLAQLLGWVLLLTGLLEVFLGILAENGLLP